MYKSLNYNPDPKDPENTLELSNEEFVNNIIREDRDRYHWAYVLLFKWLEEKIGIVILSGEWASKAYDKNKYIKIKDISMVGKEVILYTTHAEYIARELTDLLYMKSKIKLINMKPILPGSEYKINIPRQFVTIIGFEPNNGVDMIKLMQPNTIKVDGYIISVLPPDILLAGIYRKLISPQYYKDRESLQKLEHIVYKQLITNIDKGKFNSDDLDVELDEIENISGSKESKISDLSNLSNLSYFTYTCPYIVDLKKYIVSIMDEYDNNILVGKQVLQPTNHLDLLSYSISIDKQELYDIIENIHTDFLKKHPKYTKTSLSISIKSTIHKLRLPNDPRLIRIRLKLHIEDKALQLVDIFNSGQYDLIIPHPYLYLRLMLVDLWSIQITFRTNLISKEVYESQVEKILKNIVVFHSWNGQEKYKIILNDPSEYVGYYDDDIIAKRKLISNMSKMNIYYPVVSRIE